MSENTTLTEDKTVDALTVNEGVTLNLNGYKLNCTSLAGSGTITSLDGDDLTSPQGTVTGTYLNGSGVDTPLLGGSYEALFDDDFTNYGNPHRLLSGSLAYGNHLTVIYDFGKDAATVVNKFKLYNGSNSEARNPYVWKFEGTNDKDSEWTTLQTVGGYTHEGNTWTYTGSTVEAWGSSATKTNVVYTFENTTAYRYYRFVFIKTNSAYCELKQIEFFYTTAGELHVNVANGETVNSTVAISGNVKVVKEGNGTLSGITQIADGSGTTVEMVVDGGSVTTTDNFYIGKGNGAGTLTLNSGLVEVKGMVNTYFHPDGVSASTGTINLNSGGTLKTRRIYSKAAARGTLNFNGGTLQANAEAKNEHGVELAGGLIVNGATTVVNEGGGTIDSGDFAVTIGAAIGGTGAMRFKGGNTITLQGANSYKGGTIIELGTKVVASNETAKDTILGNLVIDGKSQLTDAEGIEVFQCSSALTDPDDLENVDLVNCGEDSKKYIDGNCIKVDFVVPTWVLAGNADLSDLVETYGEPAPDATLRIVASDKCTLTIDQDVTVGQLVFADNNPNVVVNSGCKVVANAINFSAANDYYVLNNGQIDLNGTGITSLSFNNASRGVYYVNNGTLKVSGVTTGGDTPGLVPEGQEPNRENQFVYVASGATYDLNGVAGNTASVRLASGAIVANSGADIEKFSQQMPQLILDGDATVNVSHSFGLIRASNLETRLDLSGYKLTITGGGSSKNFYIDNTTITGKGTIQVNGGRLYTTMANSSGADCTLIIGENGTMDPGQGLTVKDFKNEGYAAGSDKGSGWLTVTGTLTPGNPLKRLTLADRSTVKASATASQTVNNGFSAPCKVTIDASDITKAQLNEAADQRIAVLTVPTANKGGVWTVANPPVGGCRAKWVDNGNNTSTLYIVKPTGFIVIIR